MRTAEDEIAQLRKENIKLASLEALKKTSKLLSSSVSSFSSQLIGSLSRPRQQAPRGVTADEEDRFDLFPRDGIDLVGGGRYGH